MGTARFDAMEVKALAEAVDPDDKLTLVGDQGVYLMCRAQAPGERTIVYAKGCNPDADAGWYDRKVAVYGGDDDADDICSAGQMLEGLASMKHGAEQVRIRISPSKLKLELVGKAPPREPKTPVRERIKEKAQAQVAAAKARGPLGIGSRAKELIAEGLSTQEVLKRIREEFPGAKTSPASVNWYRSKMRKD